MPNYERRAISTLEPHPENPRRGDVEMIAKSLEAHGQYRPITVQASTGYVLAGNHTMLAARSLGWDDIETVVIDVDDDTARRIMLVDNRTADTGTYDNEVLLDLLRSLDDLAATGWNDDDLDALGHLWEPVDLDDLAETVGDVLPEDGLRRVVLLLPPDLAEQVTQALGNDHAGVVERWLRG